MRLWIYRSVTDNWVKTELRMYFPHNCKESASWWTLRKTRMNATLGAGSLRSAWYPITPERKRFMRSRDIRAIGWPRCGGDGKFHRRSVIAARRQLRSRCSFGPRRHETSPRPRRLFANYLVRQGRLPPQESLIGSRTWISESKHAKCTKHSRPASRMWSWSLNR